MRELSWEAGVAAASAGRVVGGLAEAGWQVVLVWRGRGAWRRGVAACGSAGGQFASSTGQGRRCHTRLLVPPSRVA